MTEAPQAPAIQPDAVQPASQGGFEFAFNGQRYKALHLDLLRRLNQEEHRDLLRSIKERGVQAPILVDEDNGIIDGLHRCILSVELGLDTIPTRVVTGLTEEKKRELAFEMNDCRRQQTDHELSHRRMMRGAIIAAVKGLGTVTVWDVPAE